MKSLSFWVQSRSHNMDNRFPNILAYSIRNQKAFYVLSVTNDRLTSGFNFQHFFFIACNISKLIDKLHFLVFAYRWCFFFLIFLGCFKFSASKAKTSISTKFVFALLKNYMKITTGYGK